MSVLSGRAIRLALRPPELPGFAAAFDIVVGFAALALAVLAGIVFLRLDAAAALAPAGAFLLAGSAGLLVRSVRSGRRPGPSDPAGGWPDAAVILGLGALALVASREAVEAFSGAERTGVLHAWGDILTHSTEVSYLRHYAVLGGKSLTLAGTGHGLYHEGSYLFPALYASLTRATDLRATLTLWVPLGLFLMGVGAYGLGSALGGRAAGAASAAALFLLPDSSGYGLGARFLSFSWLTQAVPALGYGIALILLGLALWVAGIRAGRTGLMLFGLILAALSAFFKVHTAFPGVIALLFLFFLGWRPVRAWHRLAALALVLLCGLLSVLLLERIYLAPHFLTGRREFLHFFGFILRHTDPRFGLYAGWSRIASPWLQSLAGIGLLLAAFGAVLPGALLVPWLPLPDAWPRRAGWIPFAVLGAYLIEVFTFPTPANQDFTEFSQRPFAFAYAVLTIVAFAGLAAAAMAAASRRRWLWPALIAAAAGLAAPALVLDWRASGTIQESSRAVTSPDFARIPISPGLFAASRFIREEAAAGDWVLSSDGDPVVLVAALTERPAFLSKIHMYRLLGGKIGGLAESRFRYGALLQRMRDYGQLVRFGREQGIRWFLLQPGDMPAWPAELRSRAVFESGGDRVFDLSKLGD